MGSSTEQEDAMTGVSPDDTRPAMLEPDVAMLEPDDTSIIPRARAHYGNDRWREVRGLPAAPAAVEADLTEGQRRAFRRLIEILDEPMIGVISFCAAPRLRLPV
jgi:hypothetical protein